MLNHCISSWLCWYQFIAGYSDLNKKLLFTLSKQIRFMIWRSSPFRSMSRLIEIFKAFVDFRSEPTSHFSLGYRSQLLCLHFCGQTELKQFMQIRRSWSEKSIVLNSAYQLCLMCIDIFYYRFCAVCAYFLYLFHCSPFSLKDRLTSLHIACASFQFQKCFISVSACA